MHHDPHHQQEFKQCRVNVNREVLSKRTDRAPSGELAELKEPIKHRTILPYIDWREENQKVRTETYSLYDDIIKDINRDKTAARHSDEQRAHISASVCCTLTCCPDG